MTEAGCRAATIVICDLILPEKMWQALGANSLDAIGVREDGGIDWQGEVLQSEWLRLLSYTCPFRASVLGHPAKSGSILI